MQMYIITMLLIHSFLKVFIRGIVKKITEKNRMLQYHASLGVLDTETVHGVEKVIK